MNMNQRIRQYIKSKELTFTKVAERSGIELKKFSRLMTNKQPITSEEYERICSGLEVDPRFFYSENFLESKNNSA